MKWVTFECRASPGREVLLGGTFNRWKPSRLDKLRDKRHDGTYRTLVNLHTGRHEYDFLVDGVWLMDPGNAAHLHANVMDVV
jgi:1,4-alpha-glucan branching enzyme